MSSVAYIMWPLSDTSMRNVSWASRNDCSASPDEMRGE